MTTTATTVNVRVNRGTTAVHAATVRDDGTMRYPFCGAPGNTPRAHASWRPVTTTDPVTCRRCVKIATTR